MSVQPAAVSVSSHASLDALVGIHITRETPEVYWEDMHGLFKFESEEEAWRALGDQFYQLFLPNVDWTRTVVRQVERYRRYSSDSAAMWAVVSAAVIDHGPLHISWQNGRWQCAFREEPVTVSRFPGVSICVAALRAYGVSFDVDLDRIEAELNRLGVRAMMELGKSGASPEWRDEQFGDREA